MKTGIEKMAGGNCPRCGYRLIKHSLNFKCARCDFSISKTSSLGKKVRLQILGIVDPLTQKRGEK